MIVTFTKKIAVAPDFIPEFYFNRIHTAGGPYFHVSVLGKAGNVHHFSMTELFGSWKIVDGPHPPDWVLKLETHLNHVICQGLLS